MEYYQYCIQVSLILCSLPFGGTNDYPCTPTFLQIYKILSVLSILKPPKLGNCTLRKKIWFNQIKWLVWTTFFDLKKWFV